MIFSIRDLAFEIGSLYLEGWLALAARCVCALLLFAAGALVSLLLRRKLAHGHLHRIPVLQLFCSLIITSTTRAHEME